MNGHSKKILNHRYFLAVTTMLVVICKRLLTRFKQSTFADNVTAYTPMNITKMLLPASSAESDRETIYLVRDGENVTFIHESVYDGRVGEGKEWENILKPTFRVLKPEETTTTPDLLSFLEAVSKGKQDSHPRSAARFERAHRERGSRH